MPSLSSRLARIAPYYVSGRRGFAVAVAAMVVGAATEPAIPALLQPVLDRGFQQGTLPLWFVPAALIGLFLVRGSAGYLADIALAWGSNRGLFELRRTMFERVLTAQPALFGAQSASSLTNTVVYEALQGSNLLVYSLLTLLKDSLAVVALLGYLLWLNWQLTLFVLVLAPAVAIVMRIVSKRLHRLTLQSQAATDELAYVVEENVLAWRIVRLHGAAAQQAARFTRSSEWLRRLMLKSTAAGSSVTPITQMMAAAALSAVIAVALWQGKTGETSVGGFVAFVTAMLMLIAPVKRLSDLAGPLTRALTALERGVALIEGHQPEAGGTHDPGRAKGHVELRDVTVRYRDDQPPALDGVTLELRPGEAVALVGPSGGGKSTLVNLLPRFIEPTGGDVRLDGHPLGWWETQALRRQFALVSQDVVLFNDTIAENVCLGGTLDRERVLDALRSAHLTDFVATQPEGIDTVIGHNGSKLSGGQRQRLAIARAIYKDAPILILDEATSALDSESERSVQAALELLMKGRTSLVIAHRLSTIERADRIVALEGGRIVEQGTHAELLAAGGLYARLHALQFRS
jgi:subfamily B ATP-binding cassette protein MsbA